MMKVLAIDIGGTHVKILASGQKERREFESGRLMTPRRLLSEVRKRVADWKYDVVSIGYPGPVLNNRPVSDPWNLGKGWAGFDFEKAFKCPVKVVNDAAMQAWRREMAALAALPHVACKISGLLTELSPADRTSRAQSIDCLRPVIDALLGWFGPGRLMWGSDWPVLTLAGGYDDWVAVSDALLGPLSADERAQVLHGTARRFYGIA